MHGFYEHVPGTDNKCPYPTTCCIVKRCTYHHLLRKRKKIYRHICRNANGHDFWNCKRIMLMDYLQKGRTITHTLQEIMNQFHRNCRKTPPFPKKKAPFLQENPRAHSSRFIVVSLHDLRYRLLPHPPYSPDLAPRDFF